eukprot:1185121-Prorocentrum_minimum.AAC.2
MIYRRALVASRPKGAACCLKVSAPREGAVVEGEVWGARAEGDGARVAPAPAASEFSSGESSWRSVPRCCAAMSCGPHTHWSGGDLEGLRRGWGFVWRLTARFR